MKSDARVRYTKKVIKENFLKLLAEKPLQKITVREICEAAQINRATFYTHYHDPFDLLEQIEDEAFEELFATILTASHDERNFASKMFTLVKKDADLFKILFSENGDKKFLKKLMEVPRDRTVAEWHQRYPQATEQQLDVLHTFLVSGVVGVVEQWVRTGMREEIPLDIGVMGNQLIESWLRVSR